MNLVSLLFTRFLYQLHADLGLGRVEEMKEKMMIVEEIEEVDQVTKMKILHAVKEKAELVLALAVQVVHLVVVLVVQLLVAVLQALIHLDQDQEAKKVKLDIIEHALRLV